MCDIAAQHSWRCKKLHRAQRRKSWLRQYLHHHADLYACVGCCQTTRHCTNGCIARRETRGSFRCERLMTLGVTLGVNNNNRPPDQGGRLLFHCASMRSLYGGPAGTRTQDTRLKRPLLYQLSYRPTNNIIPTLTYDRKRLTLITLHLIIALSTLMEKA
jgi:hypothetical protein